MKQLIAKIIHKFIPKKIKNIVPQKTKLNVIKFLLNIDLVDRINRLNQINLSTCFMHQKTFLQFKGVNKGKDIYLIASGVTAKQFYPKDSKAIYIGVNRSFQIDNYRIPMDYIFIQDYSGTTKEYIDDLDNYRQGKCQKFYGLVMEGYNNKAIIPQYHVDKANALRYRTDAMPLFDSKFAYDISTQPLGDFSSIAFPALQFAFWTHPKNIYLVGCDCTQAGYAYKAKNKNFLNLDTVLKGYTELKKFRDFYYPDVEIFSINPIGLKGMFKDIYTDI